MELISTIEEIQEFVPVISSSEYSALKPYIRMAQRNYLLPVLGADFLTELEEAYTTASKVVTAIEGDELKEAFLLVQEVVSNLAVSHALPSLSVNIGTNGMMVVKNANTAPASQWRSKEVMDSLSEIGFKALDSLLAYLDQEKETFTTWAADPVYKVYQEYFIRNATSFSSFYNIRESRFLFHIISYCMRRVEAFEIKGAIGSILFDKLKEKDKDGSIDGKMLQLMQDFIKPAIALFTVAKALQERLISMTGGNLSIKFSGATDNMDESRGPLLTELNQSIESLRNDAKEYIRLAQEFIKENPTEFAEFTPTTASRRRMNAANGADRDLFIF